MLNNQEDLNGDGIVDSGETDPFALDTNEDMIMDGYPKEITDTDWDGDGLHCKWELYYGTQEGDIDYYKDSDVYPDGFEVANNMNPLEREPGVAKIVPLDFDPPFPEGERIYTYVKNPAGRIRTRGISFFNVIPDGNLSIRSCYPLYSVPDKHGIRYCDFSTSLLTFDNNLYPTDGPYPSYGRAHSLSLSVTNCDDAWDWLIYPCGNYYDAYHCDCSSDQIRWVAIPQGTSIKKYIDNQWGYINLISPPNPQLCAQVGETVHQTQWKPQSNKPVTFSVLTQPGDTIPQGFQNASLSKRWTMSVPPYEFPMRFGFLGDDPSDLTNSLEVISDENGYACVRHYLGNTDNFKYKIMAKLQQGTS